MRCLHCWQRAGRRDWIDHSGWPMRREEMQPFLGRASKVLNLGPHHYDEDLWQVLGSAVPEPSLDWKKLRSQFWQFSKGRLNPKEPTRLAQDFAPEASENLNVLLHANVTHVNTDATGSTVESVDVASLSGKRKLVRAPIIVLCCGGTENARLLLASTRQHPRGLGNRHDMVGRFFMDHPFCELGEFTVADSRRLLDRYGHYWLDNETGRHVYLHGLSLSARLQEHEKLLNCAAYLILDGEVDSSLLIAKRIVMAVKGRQFGGSLFRDIWRLSLSFHKLLGGLYRRYVDKRPEITVGKRVALGCNPEQLPDPDSRITLSDKLDQLGMPKARIDWKLDSLELATALRMSELINEEFQRVGLPTFRENPALRDNPKWRDEFFDVAHHMGSTRMSDAPQDGVVDTNCQVHDVEGLFIGGSSVFTTSGTANPTLMIVALALRLADHIKAVAQEKATHGRSLPRGELKTA